MLTVLLRTAILYVFLNFIMRFMGKRQIGQLDVSEMISTLLLSELIAVPISDTGLPLLSSIVPVLFIFAGELFLSAFKNRSKRRKEILEGKPRYIIYKGKLLQKTLYENRISINEFLSSLRTSGVFSIATVEYAILEPNGSVSILQKESDASLSSGEFHAMLGGGNTPRAPMAHSLIIDGEIMEESLSLLGFNKEWLQKKLKEYRLLQSEVFLFSFSEGGECFVIKKEDI